MDTIASNKLLSIKEASLFLFGVLHSEMHMAWVRHICGRLKSDFSYSPSVYNNFPFPNPNPPQKATIEASAQAVLDVRAAFAGQSLAQLYDPLSMPPALTKAHAALDKAVDRAYRSQPFPNDRLRMEFLFTLYLAEVVPLASAPKAKRSARPARASDASA